MWVNKKERCTPAASQRSVQVRTGRVYFSKWFVLKQTTPETSETLLTWGFPERRTRSGHSGAATPRCRSSSGRTEGSSGTTTPRSCRGRLPLPGSGSSVPSRLWERHRRREESVDKRVDLQNLLLKVSYSTHFESSLFFLNNILQWSSFAWLNQHLAGLLSFDIIYIKWSIYLQHLKKTALWVLSVCICADLTCEPRLWLPSPHLEFPSWCSLRELRCAYTEETQTAY